MRARLSLLAGAALALSASFAIETAKADVVIDSLPFEHARPAHHRHPHTKDTADPSASPPDSASASAVPSSSSVPSASPPASASASVAPTALPSASAPSPHEDASPSSPDASPAVAPADGGGHRSVFFVVGGVSMVALGFIGWWAVRAGRGPKPSAGGDGARASGTSFGRHDGLRSRFASPDPREDSGSARVIPPAPETPWHAKGGAHPIASVEAPEPQPPPEPLADTGTPTAVVAEPGAPTAVATVPRAPSAAEITLTAVDFDDNSPTVATNNWWQGPPSNPGDKKE